MYVLPAQITEGENALVSQITPWMVCSIVRMRATGSPPLASRNSF
jgi:hypothetical protein